MEGSSLYKIAVDLTARDADLDGPFQQIIRSLESIQNYSREATAGFSSMGDGLSRAVSEARVLRDLMRDIARDSRTAGGFHPGYAPFGEGGGGYTRSSATGARSSAFTPPPRGLATMYDRGPGGPYPYDGEWERPEQARLGYDRRVIDAEWSDVTGRGGRYLPGSSATGAGRASPSYTVPGAGGRNPNNAHLVMSPLDISRMAWNATTAGLQPAMFEQQQLAMLRATRGEATAQTAFDTAHAMAVATPGTTLAGNYGLFNALLSVTQDAGEAASFAKSSAKYGIALEQINPKAGDYATQLEDVARSAEFLGLVTTRRADGSLHFNQQGANRILGMATSLSQVTSGQFGPNKLLTFLRSAGSAGAELDLGGVMANWPYIQSQGAARAGTALSAQNQQFAAGRASQGLIDILINAGLIHGGGDARHNKFIQRRGVGVYQILPGGMDAGAQEEAMRSPVKFIHDRLMPLVDREIERTVLPKGRHLSDLTPDMRTAYESNMLQMFSSRIPAGSYMSEMMRAYPQAMRDLEAIKNLPDPIKALGDTPVARTTAFTSSLNQLLSTLGSDLVPAATTGASYLASAVSHTVGFADSHRTARAAAGVAGLTGGVMAGGAAAGLAAGGAAWGANALNLTRVATGMELLAVGISKVYKPLALVLGLLDAAYHVWNWESHPSNDGVASWMRGHHMGWMAPSAVTPQAPVPVVVQGGVHVNNPHEIATATTARAGRAISAPHAQSPHDYARSVPAAPGNKT